MMAPRACLGLLLVVAGTVAALFAGTLAVGLWAVGRSPSAAVGGALAGLALVFVGRAIARGPQ
jgi:hypothetical protein